MRQFLRTLPAFFAIAIMTTAPFIAVYSFAMILAFAAKHGLEQNLWTLGFAFIGAFWEAAIALVIAKDLIKQ